MLALSGWIRSAYPIKRSPAHCAVAQPASRHEIISPAPRSCRSRPCACRGRHGLGIWPGHLRLAASERAEADRYFDLQIEIQERLASDPETRLNADEWFDLRENLLTSLLFQRKFTATDHWRRTLLAAAEPGDPTWLLARLHQGVVLRLQSPDRTEEAAAAFDEVLASPLTNRRSQDRLRFLAACWRIDMAWTAGDQERVRSILRQVDGSENCHAELRAEFIRNHARAAKAVNVNWPEK